MKKFKDNKIYLSRSEMVRVAIRDFLIKEAKLYNEFIDPILKTDNINTIKIPNGNGNGTYKYMIKIGVA